MRVLKIVLASKDKEQIYFEYMEKNFDMSVEMVTR